MLTNRSVAQRLTRLRFLSVAMLLGIFAAIAVPAVLGGHYVYRIRGLWEVAFIAVYVVVAAVIAQGFATAYFHDGLKKLEKELREQEREWSGKSHSQESGSHKSGSSA